jgi:hypothetical protein
MRLGAHIMLFVLEMAIQFSDLPTCPVNVTFIGRGDCLLAGVSPLWALYSFPLCNGICPFVFKNFPKEKVTTSVKKKTLFPKTLGSSIG